MRKINQRRFSVLLLALLAGSVFATGNVPGARGGNLNNPGKIKPPDDPRNVMRCENREITIKKCDDERDYALKMGLLTQGEFDALLWWNLFPAISRENVILGYCPCSCLDPKVPVYVRNIQTGKSQWLPIKDLKEQFHDYTVWTLDGVTELSSLKLAHRQMRYMTNGPELKPLIQINTSDGSEIGVTEGHALLKASGEMTPAKELLVGDSLVNAQGQAVKIRSLLPYTIEENVMNLLTDTDTNTGHLILAGNLIVGDLAWENSLKSETHALIIRQ